MSWVVVGPTLAFAVPFVAVRIFIAIWALLGVK